MTAQSGSGLGARLERARLRTGLTVIQAAERLHVDPRVIEALEAERFEELGASVFVRGHIRHYAELVAEDPAELQALYGASAHAAQTPDLRQVPQGRSPVEESNALLVPAIVVVCAVAIIGIVWWVAGTLRAAASAQSARTSVAQTVTSAQRAATAAPGGAASSAPATALAASDARPAVDAAARPAIAPASAPSSATSAPARGELTPVRAERQQAAVGAPESTGSAALSLHFSQDSWTEVYDAHGRRLFYDVGSADSTRTVSGTPPLRIVLGNPAGVSLQLDGRPVPIPDSAEPNVRIEFEIRAAPSHLAAAADDAGGARAP